MINVLIVNEDDNLIERFKVTLKDSIDVHYLLTNTSDDAVNLISNESVDIGIFSLSMPIMNGDELADVLIANNPESRFAFMYDESNLELAISMFNSFNNVRLIGSSNVSSDELSNIISDISVEYFREDSLSSELNRYREVEKSAKGKMDEMSQVLNSRIECYNSLNKLTVDNIKYLCSKFNNDEINSIIKFFNYSLAQYIQDYLMEEETIDDTKDVLVDFINDTAAQRHYQFISTVNECDNDNCIRISYASFFLSHLFADFLERFRIKVELLEGEHVYRLDFLADTRLGNENTAVFEDLKVIARKILKGICDKLEFASKDGIVQYRLFFRK